MRISSRKRIRRQPDHDSRCLWQQLTTDIKMDILSRLPVKALLNCKVVCKEWLCIICGDSHFARLQLSRSPLHILVQPAHNRSNLKLVDLGSCCGSDFKVDKTEFTPENSLPACSHFRLVNSCNGLVFCYGIQSLFVCNPILNEFVAIPHCLPDYNKPRYGLIGLGFCPKNNEYKVLRTLATIERANRFLPTVYDDDVDDAQIYDIKSGVWRSIGTTLPSTSRGCLVELPNAFLHGSLHWICSLDKGPKFGISCFNFDTEQFQQLPLPRGCVIEGPMKDPQNARTSWRLDNSWKLGLLGGCLVFFVHPIAPPPTGLDMWVMKDYGVQESWTKTHLDIMNNNNLSCYEPSIFVSGRQILMIRQYNKNTRSLVRYRYKLKSRRFAEVGIGTRTDHSVSYFDAVAYTPSFVSLYDVSKAGDVVTRRPGIRKPYSWLLAASCRSHSAGAGMQQSEMSTKITILDSPMIKTTSCDVCFGDLGYVFRGQGIPMCQPCYDARCS